MEKREKFRLRQRGIISYFLFPTLQGLVIHGFGTKIPYAGGCSKIEEIFRQRKQLCDTLQVKAPFLLHLQQVHQDRIFVAREPPGRLTPGEYDGIITDSPQLALSVVTADCLPILLYERTRKIIGAVHAGWRGTSLGILRKALHAIEQNYGGRIQHCIVLLGPCLKPCCFEIRHDVLTILQERLPSLQDVIHVVKDRMYFDLQRANFLQARAMGVPEENIRALNLCTCCHPGWFHSYRRDNDRAGRMISVISLS